MIYILLIILSLISIFNTALLICIGIFLVRIFEDKEEETPHQSTGLVDISTPQNVPPFE